MKKRTKKKTPARSNGKHPGGRPSDYSEDILAKTIEYIEKCEDDERTIVKQANGEKGYEMYDNKIIVNLPTIEGLALYLEVHRDTIYDWAEQHKEFSDTLDKLRAKQASMLISKGLSGDYNPTIAKLILSTNHGYVEKSESKNEHTHSLGALFDEAAKHDEKNENLQNKKSCPQNYLVGQRRKQVCFVPRDFPRRSGADGTQKYPPCRN